MTGFNEKLQRAWRQTDSMLCVGLDPDPERFPPHLQHDPHAIQRFCEAIVDATADLACAFKPQIAYFAAQGAEAALVEVIRYIRHRAPHAVIILDAKRGDIGSTAQQYAREAFERYNADSVTLNPYMGSDTLTPFLDWADRGIFVLCRTSNPGGDDFQMLSIDGTPLYQRVARRAASEWNHAQQVGLVVGATYPAEIGVVRREVGAMPLLVPGIGAQGGDLAATLQQGMDTEGYGLLINSSRAILYASAAHDFADAARLVAQETLASMRALRAEILG